MYSHCHCDGHPDAHSDPHGHCLRHGHAECDEDPYTNCHTFGHAGAILHADADRQSYD